MKKPQNKRLKIELTKSASSLLLKAAESQLQNKKANAKAIFSEELQKLIDKDGLVNLIEEIQTSNKYIDRSSSGN